MHQFLLFTVLGKRIKAIPYMMRDKSVPKRKKALIIIGLIYLFLPFDIIPVIIFPLGWVDDLILWVWIIWYLKDELDKYWIGEKPQDLSKKYRHKTVIHDVDFEIKGDDNNDGKGENS